MDYDTLVDTIRTVLDDYFDQVDPEDTDTDCLAESVALAIERSQKS